ncbi:hypothetical protein M501DRAFT_1019775 [Patellaria atrata CBS 101060]|uniref:Uncharacterized protein n=1 Tax=Patellaria atrata CBS 101060 TaxID=1346257 RepID=A0A9P4VPH6_9PEZI|nr:hypothetical protein M501DRAFT_1019775 [Patellaria atrata CBS 101060]
MDKIRIQKWIEQTKIDEEAETLHELGLHPFLAGRGAAADLPPTGRSKRKRSHTDSSLLQAQPACKRSLRGDIDSDAEEKLLKTSSDALLDPGSSASESSTPSNKYQRKPRHKTRPDLYEVKEKSRAKPVNDGGNGKRRKSKRKTRKRKEDRQGTGLVQAFRAKNVASERLTVRSKRTVFLKRTLIGNLLVKTMRASGNVRERSRILSA